MIYPKKVFPVEAELHDDIMLLSCFSLQPKSFSGKDPGRFGIPRYFVVEKFICMLVNRRSGWRGYWR